MNRTSAFLLPLIVSLAPCTAWSLGIRLADQSPSGTGRGNAFAATADDPSAIYYNPAGITQLEGTRTLLGGYAVTLDERVSLKGGDHFSNSNGEFQGVPQSYFTWKPAGQPIALGLGIYAPFGFALNYPDDTAFRTVAHKGKIEYLTVSPVIAWKFSDSLSIAAGPTINYGKAELERGVLAKGDKFRFSGDDVAYGFTAGIMWNPHRMHHFGLTYRSATTMDFDGHSDLEYDGFSVPTPLGPFKVPGVSRRESAKASFDFPQSVVVGYSFRPTEDWNFEVNIDWTDWDSLNTVVLKQKSGNVLLPFNWRSSIFYEFGITRKLAYGLHASVGYMYSENSVPNNSFDPSIPDCDRHVFSTGLGQDLGRWNWNLAYQYTHGPSRDVALGTVVDGTYRFDSHAITLSLGYNF